MFTQTKKQTNSRIAPKMHLNIHSSSDRALAPERLPDSASTNKDRENVYFGCRRQNSVGGE